MSKMTLNNKMEQKGVAFSLLARSYFSFFLMRFRGERGARRLRAEGIKSKRIVKRVKMPFVKVLPVFRLLLFLAPFCFATNFITFLSPSLLSNRPPIVVISPAVNS